MPDDPKPPPEGAILLKFAEVAAILRVSADSVRRLVQSGKLATTRVTDAGRKMVTRASLDAYIRSATEVADPDSPAGTVSPPRKGTIKAPWVSQVDHFGPAAPRKGRPKKGTP